VSPAATVVMPRLSDSMEEGTIVSWLKDDGDEVERGDELVEIETDKATMVYEAEASGVLRQLVGEGDTVALGAVIAELLPVGSSTQAGPRNGVAQELPAKAARTPASPVARRVAESEGIDLAGVVGSGPNGRVVKRDFEALLERSAAATQPPLASPNGAKGAVEFAPLTRIQSTVARRMAESRATVPDFAVEVDVLVDPLSALRAQLEGTIDDRVPSYNDFIVKACALGLRRHPRVNGAYRDDGIDQYGRVNVGIAVAADDALLVPVITDADVKSVGAIASESRRLAGLAREAKLTPPQLSGGTFTVSNLGMFGVTRFAAVVNKPQAAILAVGAVQERPVAREGELQVGYVMSLTLCADHRVLYGADAARFVNHVKELLERPLQLLL
jgi:pyruvate dehydrogenase E2 component (dihydrolipoamide acetyltransferase)